MAKQKRCLSKGKTGGSRWAVKVLMALAVLVIVGGFFYLRSGFEVLIGSKVATKGGVIRRETRPTLSPARFVGQAAQAHEIAQEIPDVLDQLPCYCQCERHLGHKSLLSCYTDGHAGTLDICIDEALEASRLFRQGKDIQEIRARIDRQFERS